MSGWLEVGIAAIIVTYTLNMYIIEVTSFSWLSARASITFLYDFMLREGDTIR